MSATNFSRRTLKSCISSIKLRRIHKYNAEESPMSTGVFHRSLPNAPLPNLDNTLLRYCTSLGTISEVGKFESIVSFVEEFHKHSGPPLQGRLCDLHYYKPDCISKMIFDRRMKDRQALSVKKASVLMLKNSSFATDYNEQVIRGANIVFSSLRFLRSLQSDSLDPDVQYTFPSVKNSRSFVRSVNMLPSFLKSPVAHLFGAVPLDMSQYECLFQSARIPGIGIDRLKSYPKSRHIVVISRGHFYVFHVINTQNQIIAPEELVANLEFISKLPTGEVEKPSVGLLTTMNRDDAAYARDRLVQLDGVSDGLNSRNLELIDSAILVLVLCDDVTEDLSEQISVALSGPGGSRWFDKSLSLLVNPRGAVVLSFEGSGLDAATVGLRFAETVFKDAETRPVADPWLLQNPQLLPRATVRRLEWCLDEAFHEEVLLPQRDDYDANQRDALRVGCLLQTKETPTRGLCLRAGVCPDAVMQMALLMAYQSVHGSFEGGSVETVGARRFRGGRLAQARPLTTTAATRFLLVLHDNAYDANDDETLLVALRDISREHRRLVREAESGRDWDTHLWALKHLAMHSSYTKDGKKVEMPQIFTDGSYRRINAVDLQSTPLSLDTAPFFEEPPTGVLAGAHVPASPDGYGAVYKIDDEGCGATFTAWRDSKVADVNSIVASFQKSLRRLNSILRPA